MKALKIACQNRKALGGAVSGCAALLMWAGLASAQEVVIGFDDLEIADGIRHQLSSYVTNGVTFQMIGSTADGVWFGGQNSDVYQGSAAIYVRGGALRIEAPPGRTLATWGHVISFSYADLCGGALPNSLCSIPGADTTVSVSLWAEDDSAIGMFEQVLPGASGFRWFEIPLGYSSGTVHRIEIATLDRRQFDNFDFILGNGEPPGNNPDISASPTSLSFGDVMMGSAKQLEVAVTNTGDAVLQIGMVGVANGLASPFSFGSDTCSGMSVPPLGSCSIAVLFQPGTSGEYMDGFDLPSNDPDTPSLNVLVSGVGIALPEMGGSATGIVIHTVNCQNKTTRQKVRIDLQEGQTTWDCQAAGLRAVPGNQIDMTVKGFAK
jgi:hypothetical protein